MELAPLPAGSFQTVCADPPWSYSDQLSHKGIRGAANYYDCMSVKDISSVPVEQVVTERAHLYLWCTNAFIEEAHEVARAWGFQPKTVITWVKTRNDGTGVRIGMGSYFRNCTEQVVFAVRGGLKLNRRDLPNVLFAPRTVHSAKPDAFYGMVRLASPMPALELFSRTARADFVGWGLEYPAPLFEGAAA